MSTLDLHLLSDFLDGEHNEYGLDFAGTCGFLCATAVGPTWKNWLSYLFEDQEKKVPKEIIEQIKLWLADIQQSLSNEDIFEFPFDIEEADVDSSLGDWCIGFIDVMFSNEEAWFTDENENAITDLTLPMMVFSGIDDEDPQMESFRRNGQLMDDLAEEIPENLTEIYLLFHAPAE